MNTKHIILKLSEHQSPEKEVTKKLQLKKTHEAELVIAVFEKNVATNFIKLGRISVTPGEIHIIFLGELDTYNGEGFFAKVAVNQKSSRFSKTQISPVDNLYCTDHSKAEKYLREKEKYRYEVMLWYKPSKSLRDALGNVPMLIVDDRFADRIRSISI